MFLSAYRLVHRLDKLFVALGLFELALHVGHGLKRIHVGEYLAQHPHTAQRAVVLQEVVAACARHDEVDGREDALVGQGAVELEFHVAGAFKLFKNHFVHLRTRVDEGRGNDGERTAAFDVARGTEEAFGFLQGVGVDTTGKDFS